MVKYFLDTNFFMRSYEGTHLEALAKIAEAERCISALTIHITCYVHSISIPDKTLSKHLTFFTVLAINKQIISASLDGPTSDYEDNVQLNTAAYNNIPTFITLDTKLLKLKKYQNTAIISPDML